MITLRNLQQVPSHDKLIRMMFQPSVQEHTVEINNNQYVIPNTDDIEISPNKWKLVKDLVIGDKILTDDGNYDIIKSIDIVDNNYILKV